jgi:allophanate hydrolase
LGATGAALPEAESEGDGPEPNGGALVQLAVVGSHLSGEPLNHELTALGARLVRTTQTAPVYRLYALPGGPPARPGLVRTGSGGTAIEAEVWTLDPAAFGAFAARVPAPLAIGTVTLADGGTVKGFLCESHAVAEARDISHLGGWRAYRQRPADTSAA